MRLRSRAIAAICVMLALAVTLANPFASTALADDYNKDMDEAFAALEKATWLTTDEYTEYARVLHDYEKERSDCFAGLVKLAAQPDKDISSSWTSTRGLGAVALAQVKDRIPKLEQLGLKDWAARQSEMFEKLKGDQFLASRMQVITLKEAAVEAGKKLGEKWKEFDDKDKEDNIAMSEKEEEFKEKLTELVKQFAEACEMASHLAEASGHEDLAKALEMIGKFGSTVDTLRDVLEVVHAKMRGKKPDWEYLEKLNDFQEQIWEQVQPQQMDKALSDAKFDDVSGSDDYKAFTAAIAETMKAQREAAAAADEEYRKVITGKFVERSADAIESIKQYDQLGKNWKAVDDLEKSANDTLDQLQTSIDKLRDGPEKEQATEALKEARDGLKKLTDDEQHDMDEYKSEGDKIKD